MPDNRKEQERAELHRAIWNILLLVEKYHQSNCTDKEILAVIDKAIGASIELRSKKDLIEHFIERVVHQPLSTHWEYQRLGLVVFLAEGILPRWSFHLETLAGSE